MVLFLRVIPSWEYTLKTEQILNCDPLVPDPPNLFPKKTVPGQALDLLVHASFVHLCTSTLCLLPCSLQGVLPEYSVGYLILGGASRLDAFSVYLFRT